MPGTINPITPVIFVQKADDNLCLSFDASVALKEGEEVRLTADKTVGKRTGTQFPVGVVVVGANVNEKVTVSTPFSNTMQATAKGATLNAGDFVKPNGIIGTNGLPEYVAVVTGDFTQAIVLKGGAVDSRLELGILRSPFKV
jgi:hypothetical protein